MGVKSTHSIERELAIEIIQSKIEEASNEEIGHILECFKKESEYRNYRVEQAVDSDSSMFNITSLEDFNQTF